MKNYLGHLFTIYDNIPMFNDLVLFQTIYKAMIVLYNDC